MMRLISALTVMMVCGCVLQPRTAPPAPDVIVNLELARFPDTPPLTGISNLMFDTLGSSALRVKRERGTVEVAPVFEGVGFAPVYAIRYHDADSVQRIVVDADTDSDFTNNVPLVFRHAGSVDIADIAITLRSSSRERPDGRLAMQIIVAAPYTYGRISEYRRGTIAVAGHSYAMTLRSPSRSSPVIDLTSRPQLFIDADRDGHIRERGVADETGRALLSEEVRIDRPFSLGGTNLVVTAFDAQTNQLHLRSSAASVAPAVGLIVPPLVGRDLNGVAHSLKELRGKVVLVSFWATTCPWSEQARPALDSLAARLGNSSFAWLAMARDDERELIRAHVSTHPMSATVLTRDSTAWMEFNPSTITPLFYLIDRRGKVRLVESGAGAVTLVVHEAIRAVEGAP
jgi:thiol-disulfide isomerase/thioredoxin